MYEKVLFNIINWSMDRCLPLWIQLPAQTQAPLLILKLVLQVLEQFFLRTGLILYCAKQPRLSLKGMRTEVTQHLPERGI